MLKVVYNNEKRKLFCRPISSATYLFKRIIYICDNIVQFFIKLFLLCTSVELRNYTPPKPAHQGNFKTSFPHSEVAERIAAWSPNDTNNAWELSGQFEGDIMLPEHIDKNVLQDENKHWLNATVPYLIEKEDFSEEDCDVIIGALKEYNTKTCVKFRPFKKGDEDFIKIQGNESGCWSFVGRHGGGQVVNLQNPGCVHHGIVTHELLHALGFYHQQSAHDRDDYVRINWENIKEGREHNFKKYSKSVVTDFGVQYDYGSIMHYSAYAFSKNDKPTITPLEEGAKIGQREGLSEKDIKKLSRLYKCNKGEDQENYGEYEYESEEVPDIEEEEEHFILLGRTVPSKYADEYV